MKKILYIGNFTLPDKDAAAQRVVSNGKILRELGYEVVFYGLDKDTKTYADKRESHFGFGCYHAPYPKSTAEWAKNILNIGYIKKFIRENGGNDFCAVIAYNFPGVALLKLKMFCYANSMKLFADCTEWYDAGGGFLHRVIKRFDTFVRMRIAQPHLNGVIAISRYLYDYYEKRTNTIELPPLVDLDDVKWNSEISPREDKKRFIYAGSPGNGGKDQIGTLLEYMSAAAEDGHDFELKIIGITKEQYLHDFGKPSIQENIKDKVLFLGRIEHKKVIAEISNADIFVFLRRVSLVTTAGFPTKFAESISAGTPVLTSRTSNLDDYLSEGRNGFFIDIDNKYESVKKIKEILSLSPVEIATMKQNCREKRQFDYRNYVSEFMKFISK